MEYYISVGLIAVAAALSCLISLPMLKIIQLSGYRTRGVIAWWKGTAYDVLVRYAALAVFGFITTVIYVACFKEFEYARYCAVALYVMLAVIFVFSAGKSHGNSIKLTPRAIRLIAADAVLSFVPAVGVGFATYASVYCQTLVALFSAFAPFIALGANAIMAPFERMHNKKFMRAASQKLAQKSPVVIGITGSYGKTTAKNLLAAMLKSKYTVLATPGSYNTPMGVSKTINDMLADEQYFIAELGARYHGDIAELCDIVAPRHGIITAVGDMHLETLGSRSGVASVKYELAQALPKDGLLVLNGYDSDCAALAERKPDCRVELAGSNGRVSYSALEISASGTSFTLNIDGTEYPVTTKLLGSHIAELVCMCATLALECGVLCEDIVAAVTDAPAVEHRLQLLTGEDSAVTVIDDAYNSNPVGARNALDVLACFSGTRIIITPGFVELGTMKKQCNTDLGAKIAEVCDHAYLVGSGAADIKKGAVKAGMSEERVRIFPSRDDAVKALGDIAGSKTVLFENDLPDHIK